MKTLEQKQQYYQHQHQQQVAQLFTNETIVIVAKSCTKGPKTYFIFIRVFNLWGLEPKSTHAFSHACFPSLNFFGHVIPFWMSTWANLIDA